MVSPDGPLHRRAALVALYGTAAATPFGEHVSWLQARVAAQLGAFAPRPLETLHTTIIGLDQGGPWPVGDELSTLLRSCSLDLGAVCRHVAVRLAEAPLVLQYGGFADRDLSVTSRGRRLYERSLTVSRSQVVLVGWPVENGRPSMRLDGLRRELVAMGCEHRYPLTDGVSDPDAHLVIGELDGEVPSQDLDELLERLRAELSLRRAQAPVSPQDIRLVLYDDPRLPVGSTVQVPLAPLLA